MWQFLENRQIQFFFVPHCGTLPHAPVRLAHIPEMGNVGLSEPAR